MERTTHRWGRLGTGIVVAILLGGVLPAGSAGGEASLLARLQARYRELPPFTVRFRQALVSPTFGEEEQARGTIIVGPSGRIAWRYDEPPGMRAVFDGHEWRLLDPEERELIVRRSDVPGREGDRLLADLLTGRADLLEVFAVVPGGDEPPAPRDRPSWRTVRLVPRRSRDDLDRLELEIDPGPPDLRRLVIVDPLGSRLAVDFGPPERVRGALPPGTFEIEVPAGYTIGRE